MKKQAYWMSGALVLLMATTGMAMAQGKGGEGRGARIDAMFESFDLDGDGKVTAAEIEEAGAQRFAAADTDGDGFLSADEVAAQAEQRRAERMEKRRAARAEAMLERLDTDGDGKLSPQEAAKRGPAATGFDRMLQRLDADEDGAISREEIETAQAQMHDRRDRGGRFHDRGDHEHRGGGMPRWMQRH
ncbi:EF-hand domain-containing protein [Pseudoponticoccus marisrubri]|uniref:EF-hand domain-containing protein n=1 Tax=Pseudoponticoccus marisrubri TaxID=1685382 RepID=A0A0W7WNK2_9RHOB|nr:EF-hand domain-containing protein [Pseudoponticoccus marisrubri]KUF12173.1 hypothetical protein AVJ23_00085 [Pseudoponticoccus marisrubri]